MLLKPKTLNKNNHNQVNKGYLNIGNLKFAHLTQFSTTQYLSKILHLPTQIQMYIVYQKIKVKCEFSRFLIKVIFTYIFPIEIL